MQNQRNSLSTFDTQLKTALLFVFGLGNRPIVYQTRPSVRVHWVACGTCTVPDNFFQGHQEVIPEEALWLTGPHTFVRRNRSVLA